MKASGKRCRFRFGETRRGTRVIYNPSGSPTLAAAAGDTPAPYSLAANEKTSEFQSSKAGVL